MTTHWTSHENELSQPTLCKPLKLETKHPDCCLFACLIVFMTRNIRGDETSHWVTGRSFGVNYEDFYPFQLENWH